MFSMSSMWTKSSTSRGAWQKACVERLLEWKVKKEILSKGVKTYKSIEVLGKTQGGWRIQKTSTFVI